jgi:RNA polymerase sigma-70 factor (ECF subfamily)
MSEAEDAAQEAWLRLDGAETSGVENLAGWLTTVVVRVCLTMLRARESRREESLEVRSPEPIIDREGDDDPERARCWPIWWGWRYWWCWTRWDCGSRNRSRIRR